MPAWILWLSPVIVAPLLAVAWIMWSERPKGPEEAREGVEQYDRFKAALSDHSTEHVEAEHPEAGHGRTREHRVRRRAS